jgi:acetyl esterase/lipase
MGVLLVSIWIVLPTPHTRLLPITVGAPEISPVLLLSGMVLSIVTWRSRHRSGTDRIALACALITAGLSLIPLLQLAMSVRDFNGRIAATSSEPFAPLPGEVRVTRGVRFSNSDGVPLALDVYQPPSGSRFPIVMQIYGGSWQAGAPTRQEWFSRHLAQRGYLVVAIDYRHAPEWIWPEQIVDVRAAMYWISEHSAAFGGDPSRIIVVGRSAGAQLAMRLAYQEGPSSIRGVVNYYGPVDLADGWRNPPRPDPADIRSILETFIGGTPAQKPEHYRHASPITWVSRASAPTLSLYGGRDHIVEARYGRMLDAALKKAGATSVLLELPWSEHAFDAVPAGLARTVSQHYVERFMAWAVRR